MHFIIGASGSGKTTLLPSLQHLFPDWDFQDFDSIGVPKDANTQWRQQTTEQWLQHYINNNTAQGCLLGQMVPGEILACPSFLNLNDVNILLLDCDDVTRITRLQTSGRDITQEDLNWAAWLRVHCQTPSWQQHVICDASWHGCQFDRWKDLSSWCPLANIITLDTSQLTIEETQQRVGRWLNAACLAQGARVYLSSPQPSDQQEFITAANESEALLLPWVTAPNTAEQFQAIVQRQTSSSHMAFFVRHAQSNDLIGVININEIVKGCFNSAYLGYYCFDKFANQGYMTEALQLAIQYAFAELQLHRLEANIQPDNLASIALVERCGFIKEGYSAHYLKINDQWQDHIRYAVTHESVLES